MENSEKKSFPDKKCLNPNSISPLNDNQTDTNKKSNAFLLNDISKKDFFDFMRTAYQIYECVEGENNVPNAQGIDWDELEKNPVIKMLLENNPFGSDDLAVRRGSEGGAALESGTSPYNFPASDLEGKENSLTVKAKKGNIFLFIFLM